MPAGFTVVGDHGYLQIDDQYKNFALSQKGTATLTTQSGLPTASITVTAKSPIMCFRSGSAYVSLYSVSTSGDTHTYGIRGSGNASFDWYLFDQMPQTVDSSGAGIVVYAADSSVLYNSAHAVMRIAAVATVPNGDGTDNPPAGSVNAAAGTYAACLLMSRSTMIVKSGQQSWFYLDGVRTRGDGADTGYVLSQVIPSQATGDSRIGGTMLLIDVAGL